MLRSRFQVLSGRNWAASAPSSTRRPLTGSSAHTTRPLVPSFISPTLGIDVTARDLLREVSVWMRVPLMAIFAYSICVVVSIERCAFQGPSPPVALIESARIWAALRSGGGAGGAVAGTDEVRPASRAGAARGGVAATATATLETRTSAAPATKAARGRDEDESIGGMSP